MLVFLKPGLVLLATPKTASTAIEQALGPVATMAITTPKALKHTDITQFESHLRPYLRDATAQDFQTVALMREPRDWLGSWYRNRLREDEAAETSTQEVGFEEFARLVCTPQPPSFAQISSQSAFLNPRPDLRVDNIFRYDDLASFVHFIEDALNFAIVLPRLNVSPKGDLHLSAETEALVRAHFAADFALYAALP